MPFTIIRNDITKVKADAVVNTANPEPVFGSGTDVAVYKVAGAERLLAERKIIGRIERGSAALTPAFDLNAKYIIHTVGPAWEGGDTLKPKKSSVFGLCLALELDMDEAVDLLASADLAFNPYDKRDKLVQ